MVAKMVEWLAEQSADYSAAYWVGLMAALSVVMKVAQTVAVLARSTAVKWDPQLAERKAEYLVASRVVMMVDTMAWH